MRLLRTGSCEPWPSWVRVLVQGVGAPALLTVLLGWGAAEVSWVDLRAQPLQRVGLLAAVLVAAAVIYFGALWAAGVKLRQFVAR